MSGHVVMAPYRQNTRRPSRYCSKNMEIGLRKDLHPGFAIPRLCELGELLCLGLYVLGGDN